jgi:type III restriction enzyme
MLVLELKGQDNQEQQTKRVFLGEWVRAVNRHGGFGAWGTDVSRNPTVTHDTIQRHGSVMDT